jgi:integrase/recombinase XerD
LPLPKRSKTLPEVLSREEGTRRLASPTTVRERARLMPTYGGGLRVSEVVRLRVSAIDTGREMRRVEQGKGRKDRSTLLGPRLGTELRHYWQLYRPAPPWLFPQRSNPSPMATSTAQRIYDAAKARAGSTKAGGIHALRHAFTTPLLEGGADLATRQRLLGPESVTTTLPYVPVARSHLTAHGSPLENLPDIEAAGEPMPPRSLAPTATGVPAHPSPPLFEVADLVRAYGAAFRATSQVSHEQARVLRALAQCRTAAVGARSSNV